MLRLWVGALGAAALYAVAWRSGLTKLTTPGDVLLSLGGTRTEPHLRAPQDGARHLVVLLHGLGRSAWSMWKLERLLEAHGYEVWNETYDEMRAGLTELGEDLGARLERHLAATADRRPVELYAVAHSMGGLVLRCYLQGPGARPFRAIVLLGTPNGGAVTAAALRDLWYFTLLLGSRAARDLAPEAGVVAALGRSPPSLGNVIGASFDGEGRSSLIPGDDDGLVGVVEAHLEGEADAVLLDVAHTFLPIDGAVHHQVLHFLRRGRFDP